MKLKLMLSTILITMSMISLAQETPKGKVTGKVFFNYHFDTTEDVEQTSAFELTRAYFGYKYTFNDKFSTTVLFDAGKNSSGSAHTVFIKNAKLDYKADDWITLSAGVFGMKQFKDQEKFWGYRYLYKSLSDEYKFGTSADLGIMAAMKLSDQVKMDVLIVNGEGYKKLQDATGNTRAGVSLVYTPSKNFILKAYYDTMKGADEEDDTKETTVSNVALFVGYKNDTFRIGSEYNKMTNASTYNTPSENKDREGLSFYATYNLNDKWNIFGRFDQLLSNTLSGEVNDWNFEDDGDTIIAGFEFKPTKGVNTSVNYRLTDFKDATNKNASLIYFNLEFYF